MELLLDAGVTDDDFQLKAGPGNNFNTSQLKATLTLTELQHLQARQSTQP